ncbi:MAG: DUF4124 domain-containing protein [Pseudomonadota bacterium]
MQNRRRLAAFLTALILPLSLWPVWAQSARDAGRTTLYRWVDDNGVIHFSDSPRPDAADPAADKVEIRSPNVSRAPRPRPRPESNTSDADAPPAEDDPQANVPYQTLAITSPNNGETLWNIGGTLGVKVQLSPALKPGDGIVLVMDGRVMTGRPATSTSITLSNVYRGEHVLVAAVRDNFGNQKIASQPIRFVVQQSTIN